MEQKNLEKELRTWFALMLKKYTWLSIKFEFSKREDSYLVSFSPKSMSLQNEDFCRDALAFENEVNEKYGDEAPLFCDEEDLFSLSPKAEVLSNLTFSTFTREFSAKMAHFNLEDISASQNVDFESSSNEFCDEFCYNKHKYNMAA